MHVFCIVHKRYRNYLKWQQTVVTILTACLNSSLHTVSVCKIKLTVLMRLCNTENLRIYYVCIFLHDQYNLNLMFNTFGYELNMLFQFFGN